MSSVKSVGYDYESEALAREGAEVRAHGRGRAAASISVLIPAHNEASFLPRCLQSLLQQQLSQVMRVIVIDNGSSDGTAEVASRWEPQFTAAGHELIVLYLPTGNKPAALNAGEITAIPESCRVYIDADVQLSPGASPASPRLCPMAPRSGCAARK